MVSSSRRSQCPHYVGTSLLTCSGYREVIVEILIDGSVLQDPPKPCDTVLFHLPRRLELVRVVRWASGVAGELLLLDQSPISLGVSLEEYPLRGLVVTKLVTPTRLIPAVGLRTFIGDAGLDVRRLRRRNNQQPCRQGALADRRSAGLRAREIPSHGPVREQIGIGAGPIEAEYGRRTERSSGSGSGIGRGGNTCCNEHSVGNDS